MTVTDNSATSIRTETLVAGISPYLKKELLPYYLALIMSQLGIAVIIGIFKAWSLTMPIYQKFEEPPLSAIQPEGWLRFYLQKQSRGLTGHLEAAGFPFNTAGWACPKVVARGHDLLQTLPARVSRSGPLSSAFCSL